MTIEVEMDSASYTLRDNADNEETIEADDVAGARAQAREWVLGGDWDLSRGSVWIDVDVLAACGHGGGVIAHETCATCGLVRVTDTWAQRRDTGEQGFRAVTYRREEVQA